MKILTNDGSFAEVEEVGYWNNKNGSVGFIRENISTQSVSNFLAAYNGKGWNIIISPNKSMYFTPDCAGYCDGERTTTINNILAAVYNLKPITSI